MTPILLGSLILLPPLSHAVEDQEMDLSRLPTYVAGVKNGDFIMAPPYTDSKEVKEDPRVPKGKVFHFTMKSTESRIYPGISKSAPGQVVPYERRVSVYVPSQYVAGKAAPFFVSQDSMGQGILPTILDNMIAARRLPAMVGIMIDSGGGDAQGSQRGLEYDTLSGRYAEFVESEVLPRVSKECNVVLTSDPKGRMTMGGSSGGACALSMAWYRPDLYRRVLSYSGTFVNQQWPVNPETPHGAWEYHDHLIPEARRKPLRIWIEVGENDLNLHRETSAYHNWMKANMRMAKVLKAKRYPYQFVYAKNAGHVDYGVLKQTLPQALEWVWQGYRK